LKSFHFDVLPKKQFLFDPIYIGYDARLRPLVDNQSIKTAKKHQNFQ